MKKFLWILCVLLLLPACACADAIGRALLIGVDDFVSRPSAYPSSTNNVYAMQEMFQHGAVPMETIYLPPQPVTGADELARLVSVTFGAADEDDISYLYLSTHGVYEPHGEAALLLSDGRIENRLTAQQLEDAFADIKGEKVLILDACSSGAFIGKGLATPPEDVHFLDFKVLCSSGAMEESWYWSAGEDLRGQGAFYFTQALAQSVSPAGGYPADQNSDGAITLSEVYDYLLLNHAASTPQVYPQEDDFVFFRYDPAAPLPTGLERSPVMDVTFSGSILSRENRQISIEFIATRPVRVAYQIVYQRDGRWAFEKAQLIYDQAERFTAFGDQPGAVSAGRKIRTVNLSGLAAEKHGYALVQLVSIDQGKLTVHAGRVLCIPPEGGEMTLTADVNDRLDLSTGRELSIFIGHDVPCTLSIAVMDEKGAVVHRICHRRSTRPMQITPAGSVFYWDGRLKDGSFAPEGVYHIRAQANLNDASVTVLSSAFVIEK